MTTRSVYRGLCVVLVAFRLASTPALGCSMHIDQRWSVSHESRVVVGHVDDYLSPISMDGCLPGEWYPGLLVSLKSELGGSGLTGQRIEVYPYGLSASCGPQPLRIDALKSLYPPGTRLRVVAEIGNPCRGVDVAKQDGTVRLFAATYLGNIARVTPSDPDPASSEPFDYFSAVAKQQHRGDAVDFEVVKDLVRLVGARTEDERAAILRRLMVLPGYRGRACETLVKANISSESEAQRLIESCHAVSPEVKQ